MNETLKTTIQKFFSEGRHGDALPLLKRASVAFPNDAEVWRNLAHAAHHLQDLGEALTAYKQAVKINPADDWAWRELGSLLTGLGFLDEAEDALYHARDLRPTEPWLWRHLARLHEKRKDPLAQAAALELVHILDAATPNDLNAIGNAYYNGHNYAKAIEFYHLSAASCEDPAFYYNMGLAFSQPELSQELDATDAYRRALVLDPTYKLANEQLPLLIRRLLLVAKQARTEAQDLIRPEEKFQFYLNPYEMLQIEPSSLTAEGGALFKRAKRRLLNEIDLEGGVAWLDCYRLDKSRALAVVDELYDNTRQRYHWFISQQRPLLNFLTRGHVELFLYAEDFFPETILQLVEREPEFLNFLSRAFAQQYNLLLSRALERNALAVVEALFDGRRWVLPQDDDLCFDGAHRRVNDLVSQFVAKTEEGRTRTLSAHEVEALLKKESLLPLLNLLPLGFRPIQDRAVSTLRSLAIATNNVRGDADEARAILALADQFQFIDASMRKHLENDVAAVEKIIADERQYEAKLQFGFRPFHVTREGVRDDDRFFPAETVATIRWGASLTGQSGSDAVDYLFVVTDERGAGAVASWRGALPAEDRIDKCFDLLIQAALHYLFPSLIGRMQGQLQDGGQVCIGPCTLSTKGVAFYTQGLLFKKSQFVPWADLAAEINAGVLTISNKTAPGIRCTLGLRDIENAVLFPYLTTVMDHSKE